MPDIIVIAALSSDYVIGDGPDIPWRKKEVWGGELPEDLKEDMRRFKRITTGNGNNAIIMGRKTYFGKPLPNRRNIVVSSSLQPQEGIIVVRNIEEAVERAQDCDEIYSIGGAKTYGAMLPIANRMELTWVEGEWEGNVFFPPYNKHEWNIIGMERKDLVTFCTYRR